MAQAGLVGRDVPKLTPVVASDCREVSTSSTLSSPRKRAPSDGTTLGPCLRRGDGGRLLQGRRRQIVAGRRLRG